MSDHFSDAAAIEVTTKLAAMREAGGKLDAHVATYGFTGVDQLNLLMLATVMCARRMVIDHEQLRGTVTRGNRMKLVRGIVAEFDRLVRQYVRSDDNV